MSGDHWNKYIQSLLLQKENILLLLPKIVSFLMALVVVTNLLWVLHCWGVPFLDLPKPLNCIFQQQTCSMIFKTLKGFNISKWSIYVNVIIGLCVCVQLRGFLCVLQEFVIEPCRWLQKTQKLAIYKRLRWEFVKHVCFLFFVCLFFQDLDGFCWEMGYFNGRCIFYNIINIFRLVQNISKCEILLWYYYDRV